MSADVVAKLFLVTFAVFYSPSEALLAPAPSQAYFSGPAIVTAADAADAAASVAAEAAKRAWVAEAQVKKTTEANLKFIPLAKAETALAETAANTAAEQDATATALLAETRAAADQAALQAASDYLARVKSAGAASVLTYQAAKKTIEQQSEVAAAKAAAAAAAPYQAMVLRGQRVVADYNQRARALAAASSNLQAEGMTLASSAEQYQMVGQVAKASQIMMTAHSLLNQGKAMRNEAQQLVAAGKEVQGAIPLYHLAEEAAVQSAAQAANPAVLPEPSQPLY